MSSGHLATLLMFALGGAPGVTPPPTTTTPPTPSKLMEGVRAALKAARPELQRCATGSAVEACTCAVLRTLRFDVTPDEDEVAVTMPLVGRRDLTFTLNRSGRVVQCEAAK